MSHLPRDLQKVASNAVVSLVKTLGKSIILDLLQLRKYPEYSFLYHCLVLIHFSQSICFVRGRNYYIGEIIRGTIAVTVEPLFIRPDVTKSPYCHTTPFPILTNLSYEDIVSFYLVLKYSLVTSNMGNAKSDSFGSFGPFSKSG